MRANGNISVLTGTVILTLLALCGTTALREPESVPAEQESVPAQQETVLESVPAQSVVMLETSEISQPPETESVQMPETASEQPPESVTQTAQTPEISGEKYAALTFDDGPHPGTTDRLLDGLRESNVPATFFLVGEEAAANRELVLRMKLEGHQIGNHTWGHRRLDDLSEEEMLQEIGKTDALLKSILGPGEYWLRPPYGFVRAGTEQLVSVPMVKWSVDPRDWESRNTEKVISAVMESVEPGSIILLHDIYSSSVDAALELVQLLREQGYTLVTVSELLERYGIEPQAGEIYRNAA